MSCSVNADSNHLFQTRSTPSATEEPARPSTARQHATASQLAAQSGRASSAVDQLFFRVSEISSLPSMAREIVEIAGNDSATVDDLYQAIQHDPALVATLLKHVNSSYYGLKYQISDIREAIHLLGLHEVRNLALSTFVSKLFEKSGSHNHYTRAGLWVHSQAVAIVAHRVAQVAQLDRPGEVQAAGLLHDLGYILQDQYLRRHFCTILDEMDDQTPTIEIEQRILTFDHTQLGAAVATHWNFPEAIVDVIRHHHAPSQYDGDHRESVCVVAIANYLCSSGGTSALGIHNLQPLTDDILDVVKITHHQLDEVWAEVQANLARLFGKQ